MLNKKALSERDICSKYIAPAIQAPGWDRDTQILEQVSFTNGKIYVRGKFVHAEKVTTRNANIILVWKKPGCRY